MIWNTDIFRIELRRIWKLRALNRTDRVNRLAFCRPMKRNLDADYMYLQFFMYLPTYMCLVGTLCLQYLGRSCLGREVLTDPGQFISPTSIP